MTEKTKPAAVPGNLGKAGRALWRQIAAQWAADALIPDARECRLLADACIEADVLAALQAELDAAITDGTLTRRGSAGQPVTHPHVAESRRSRAFIASNLKALGMDDPAAGVPTGRQLSVSEAGRRGGQAKQRNAYRRG